MLKLNKPAFDRLVSKMGGLPLFITALIIILLFYFSFSTRLIPSTNRMNITGAENNTIEVEGVYSYTYEQYIIKERNFEYENPLIPKKSFSSEMAIILIFLIVMLNVLFLRKGKGKKFLTEEIIMAKAAEYLDRLKKEGKIEDYKNLTNIKLLKRQVDNSESEADVWLVPNVEITFSDRVPERRVLAFHPFDDGHLEFNLRIEKDFVREDTCSRCGFFYDKKILSPQGYAEWWEKFGSVRRGT